jgi:uncharacterized repeat protein (TIGR01451 family)
MLRMSAFVLLPLLVGTCASVAEADAGHVDFCAEKPLGMLAWWPLDETSGNSAEEIVQGHDGTLANGPLPVAGQVAGAYQFDGTDDYASVPDDAALDFGASMGNGAGDLSIDAWIRTSAAAGVRVILDKRTFTPTRGYALFVLDGKLGFQLGDAGGPGDSCGSSLTNPCRTYDSGVFVATGSWVHVAVTVDRDSPSGLKFYVNGAQTSGAFDPTTKPGSLANAASLSIGRRSDGVAHFAGALDEVEIFDRVVPAAEIARVYGVGSKGKCKCVERPPNLVSWWTADDCQARDRIGGNDGTFFGHPVCSADPKVGAGAWGGLGIAGPTYVKVAHHASLSFGLGDFSIDGWIKTTDTHAPIVQKGGPAGRRLSLRLDGGKLLFEACDNQTCNSMQSATSVNSGSWRFVGVTFERVAEVSPGITDIVVTLYVDGLADATANWTMGHLDSTTDMLLAAGGLTSNPLTFFNGEMDELEVFARALSGPELRALHDADRYGKCKCEEPPPNMIAWWPFDETAGPTASDIAGGHHGTYGGNPLPVPGYVGGALDFNGGSDRVTVPHHPKLNFGTGDFSVDFWIDNQNGEIQHHDILIEKPGTPWQMYAVRYDTAGGIHLHVEGTAPYLYVQPPSDLWTHVAITFEQGVPGKIKGYANGTLIKTANAPGPGVYDVTTPNNVTIGNGSDALKAILDELELYNRALKPEEVLALARAGSCGKCKTTRIPHTTDIRMQKTVNNANPVAGSYVTFQVTVNNDGPEPVNSVIVHDLLPSGLVPVTINAPFGTTYNKYSGHFVVPSVPGQGAAVVTVVAFVDTCNPLTNCATFVGAGTADTDPANDVACVTLTPQTPCSGIHGTKYRDDDRDGVRDASEPAIQGRTLRLTSASGGVSTDVSDLDGAFSFLPLAPGTWKLSELVKPNEVMTSPLNGMETITLTTNGQSYGNDVGNYPCPAPPACAEPPTDMVEWWPLDSIQSGAAGCAYTSGIVRNVRDRVFGAPAGASSCGVTSAGQRNGAIVFDGINDYVEALDHPALNFGAASGGSSAGDFSIDAWVKTSSADLQIIVDKRREDSPGGVQGYVLFTFGGKAWLQLASAAGTPANYDSGVVVSDNQWHHVAVTVDRDSPAGVQFYVDGVAAAAGDPTAHMGTLANPMPLRIARRSDSSSPGFFNGGIDEVEIFRRVLTQQEVQNIFGLGKCKRATPHVQKSIPVCQGKTSVATPITLCNASGVTDTIRWSLAALGTQAGCSIAGPDTFAPVAGITPALDPGACHTLMVTILRPLALGVGDTSCFQLTALSTKTGRCSSATGALLGDPGFCIPVDSFNDVIAIPSEGGPGGGTPVAFHVHNDTEQDTLTYRLSVVPTDPDASANEVVSLNSLPPGTPAAGTLALPPGHEASIAVGVAYVQHDALRTYDLLLQADSDGDGEPDQSIGSIGLRSTLDGSVSDACPPIPQAPLDLRWSSHTHMFWSSSGCPEVYDVYRHDGPFTDADEDGVADHYGDCFELNLTQPEAFDVSFPSPASYHTYLVTGVNGGGESTLGNASAGARLNVEPCP